MPKNLKFVVYSIGPYNVKKPPKNAHYYGIY